MYLVHWLITIVPPSSLPKYIGAEENFFLKPLDQFYKRGILLGFFMVYISKLDIIADIKALFYFQHFCI